MATNLLNVLTAIGAIGTVVAAIIAAITYKRNSKLERAKWSLSLYEKFYERADLKEVRDVLDNEIGDNRVDDLVLKCSSEFTDYLNFFEFVAFLEAQKHLTREETAALFDYYILCIKRHERVVRFIEDNGYEKLRHLLESWK